MGFVPARMVGNVSEWAQCTVKKKGYIELVAITTIASAPLSFFIIG
jgi:hypothetical protein